MKDILTILGEYGLEIKKEGSVLRAYCPFHDDTGKPNFTVYPATDSWYCFAGCGGGDVIQFVSKYEEISRVDAKLKLDGVTTDLEELKEKINSISVEPISLNYNDQLNILVSDLLNKYLLNNSDKSLYVLNIMKQFDQQLLLPVDFSKMKTILEDVKTKLGVK